jgi:hypothetical protein
MKKILLTILFTLVEFNIAQKKEQCEAIGFKPETEKFADCVLRLVELDVKQQTQNQIVQHKIMVMML